MTHPGSEELSAYVDDELTQPERVALEGHLPGCAECRATLDVLRATLTQMNELEDVVPTPQEAWALRSTIARARKRGSTMWRWSAGIAGAAAAVVAIIVVTLGGRPGGEHFAGRFANAPQASLAVGNVGRLDARSVPSLLAEGDTRSAPAPAAAAPALKGAGPGSTGFEASSNALDDIHRCERKAFANDSAKKTPLRYDVGTWVARDGSKDAFFLVYTLPGSTRELWVLAQGSCDVLYFLQS
ncbi:MAG: anti-sigma factor [Actinomycetota bacterium]